MAFNYSPKTVTDNLIFAFDAANKKSYSGTGTSITNLSRNNPNGYFVNGPTFDSANNGSIQFDGVNDYIRGNSTLTNTYGGGSSQSYDIWFNCNDITNTGGLLYWSDSEGVGVLAETGEVFIQTNGDNSIGKFPTSPLIDIDTWYNVVINFFQGSKYECFLNGVYMGEDTTTDTSPSPYRNWSIGCRIKSPNIVFGYFSGNISIVRCYNTSLTLQEIQQNYNATKSRFGL